jgi:acetyltransferase-like isoleucine patch superfamily enzyme
MRYIVLFFKKVMILFIEAIHLQNILNELAENKFQEGVAKVITNKGGHLYHGANIINYQDDPKKIEIGKNTHIRGELHTFRYGGNIAIGENCYIGDHTRIWSGEAVTIGNFVQISHNVNIIDTNAHEIDAYERAERYLDLLKNGHWKDKGSVLTSPIVIEDYVWISFNCTILKGVKIGKGAIVGANSVVVDDVPPFTLVLGNPAKVVKLLTDRKCDLTS